MSIAIEAHAKVNLCLDITGRRPDGYHLVRTVMLSVGLADQLRVTQLNGAPELIELQCAHPFVPTGDTNLVWRAVEAFRAEFGVSGGVRVELRKGIPVAAGLAGGSADAAATLQALVALHKVTPAPGQLARLAARLGADVPFCLTGGAAVATGIGDELSPVSAGSGLWFTFWKPPFGVSTPEVYCGWDQAHPDPARLSPAPSLEPLLAALKAGDAARLGPLLANDLEPITFAMHPRLAAVKAKLAAAPGACGVLMSGSGPTIFALARNETAARELAAYLASEPGTVHVASAAVCGVVFGD